MKRMGIDLSRHNGDFDLARAKDEGVTFVILKAGGGDAGLYRDGRFEENYRKARALGLNVGAYFFGGAETEAEAMAEADFFAGLLEGKTFELPVYLDVESRKQRVLGKRQLTNVIHAFCQRMEAKDFWAGIYSAKSYFADCMLDDELQRYAHWVAQWYPELTYNGTCGMWQFGGELNPIRSNRVAGVVTDQDYMLSDYPAMIRKAGRNGFGRASLDEIARQVYRGEWGNNPERKRRLEAAGYDFGAVQRRVEQLYY